MSASFSLKRVLSFFLILFVLTTACSPTPATASPAIATNAGATDGTAGATSGAGGKKQTELMRYQASFLGVFDTLTTVLGFAESQEAFDAYVDEIERGLMRYHQLFTIYDSYDGVNNIRTINENAGIAPVEVDPEIIHLLKQCLWANEISGGRTNAAFGSVLSIWHNYREQGINNPEQAALPDPAVLREANKHADISSVVIDEEKSTVYLPDPKMSLDVGSGSKGYATEMVARDIEKKGLRYAVISVGGNIRAIGSRGPSGEPWRIGLQNPDKTAKEQTLDVLAIDNLSVVTSGVYERFYTVGDVRYHHIIDPDTLFPEYRFDAVTIVTESSAIADALTTALFNMSLEEGMALLEKVGGCEALWVRGEERWSTPGYQALVIPKT